MKKTAFKKIFSVISCALFAALCFAATLIAAGCGSSTEKYSGSISEIRDAVYEGESGDFRFTAISGVHEVPFSADGKAGDKKDFTLFTAKVKDDLAVNLRLQYSFAVTVGGNEYTGLMTLHPFGDSISAEIPVRTDEPSIAFTLKCGTNKSEVQLVSVKESDDISADRALDVAMHALKDELKPLKKGNNFNCEIYVRFIPNPINADGGYYWYVAFIGEKTYAALIDRKSAEIVGIKD